MAPIERITLFKIPNEADRDRVLEQYKVLAKTATKVCTYITQLEYLLVSLYVSTLSQVETGSSETSRTVINGYFLFP